MTHDALTYVDIFPFNNINIQTKYEKFIQLFFGLPSVSKTHNRTAERNVFDKHRQRRREEKMKITSVYELMRFY